jgi:hypothetical protein
MILVPIDQSGFLDKHAQDRPLLAQSGRSSACPLLVDCVEEVGGPTVWMLQGIRRA